MGPPEGLFTEDLGESHRTMTGCPPRHANSPYKPSRDLFSRKFCFSNLSHTNSESHCLVSLRVAAATVWLGCVTETRARAPRRISQGSAGELFILTLDTYQKMFSCVGQSLSRKQIHPFPPPKRTREFKEGPVYEEGSTERNIKGR